MNLQASSCRATFVQADITPDFPVELIGYFRPEPVHAVLHPLYAQLLLWERQGERFCLLSLDTLGFTTPLAQQLREQVAGVLGTAAAHVMLCATHTHSAPAPLSQVNGSRYVELVTQRLLACARDASQRLAPCRAGWALGHTSISENRRPGCSIVDGRLGGLLVEHAQSHKPIVLLLRACAHANILTGPQISSDYIGLAREKISAAMGCPVMILQGASGNLKPAGVDTIHGGTLADAERIAGRLADDALRLRFEPRAVSRLTMAELPLELHSPVPSAQQAEVLASQSGMDADPWLAECARLRQAGLRSQTLSSAMHFFFLNEGCFCGVPDEIFCELALEAAQRAQSPLFFFSGYTNGCTGYLPTAAAWAKGGFETHYSYLIFYRYHGHVMPFEADAARLMTDTAIAGWRSLSPGC